MRCSCGIVALLLSAVLAGTADAYQRYAAQIPNGNRVPSPCPGGSTWLGVGHQGSAGGNARNQFGLDFAAAGRTWTRDLCRKDSDGDGLSNGQELGDPDCVWTPGATPARTTGLSHPGICPLDSTTCTNSWTVCPKAFSCPALTEAGVVSRNFTIKSNTPVPAKETTYICQAFELNSTATPVHMIGSRPVIVNKNVMHHIVTYACSSRPEQNFFESPQECFMGHKNCSEILNIWSFGMEGECFNPNAGFRIGGEGYRYAMLELHWNNPTKQADYTDSSGLTLYFTPSLRTYDQGTLINGEINLVLPPRQPMVSVNHTCPAECTKTFPTETRYITSAGIHMHTLGVRGRISLWRNGSLVKDLLPLQAYDYNSPEMMLFDPPIAYLRGDEVKTECYFNTLETGNTVFFGESTSNEMCLSFLSYYPNNVSLSTRAKLSHCTAYSGINMCWPQTRLPQVENGCNITDMRNGVIPNSVHASMLNNSCFAKAGCHPDCRNYLNNTLWPSNACYDPKRARPMAELLATGVYVPVPANISQRIATTLFGQRFCEQEIRALADYDRAMAAVAMTTVAPPMTTAAPASSKLTSEHLLIIIIVCSCLGTVVVLAVLALLASKLMPNSGSRRVEKHGQFTPAVFDNVASVEKTEH